MEGPSFEAVDSLDNLVGDDTSVLLGPDAVHLQVGPHGNKRKLYSGKWVFGAFIMGMILATALGALVSQIYDPC